MIGKYRVDATINKENMLQRIHTWVPESGARRHELRARVHQRQLRRPRQRHQVPDRLALAPGLGRQLQRAEHQRRPQRVRRHVEGRQGERRARIRSPCPTRCGRRPFRSASRRRSWPTACTCWAASTHNSVAVEFKDFIAVFEAPLNEERSLAVIEEIVKLIPNKPIRFVVNSHQHFDHTGGLRTYMHIGATIITHWKNFDFYNRDVLNYAPRTLQPDMVSLWPPTELAEGYYYETVRENYVLTDGTRNLHIYYVNPLQHAEGMLMAYLPKEKLLIEADLVDTDAPLPATLSTRSEEFLQGGADAEAGRRSDRAGPRGPNRLEGFCRRREHQIVGFAARPGSLAAPNDLLACLVVVALCLAVGLPTIDPTTIFWATISASCITSTTFPSFAFSPTFIRTGLKAPTAHSSTSSGPFWRSRIGWTVIFSEPRTCGATTRPMSASTRSTACWSGRLCARWQRPARLVRSSRPRCSRSPQAMPSPLPWISGRVDSVAALFYLGAFLCFARFRLDEGAASETASHLEAEGAAGRRGAWLVAALLIFICGLFAKQTLVTFPLLVLAYDVAGGRTPRRLTARERLSRYAPHLLFVLTAVAYLAFRHLLFGNAVREELRSQSVHSRSSGCVNPSILRALRRSRVPPRPLRRFGKPLS